MFKECKVFSEEECKKIVEGVFELKDSWRHRDQMLDTPFYTLGTAAYLDAREEFEPYTKLAQEENKILMQKFDWIYPRLQEKIQEVMGCETYFDPRFALPGFHVFLSDIFFEDEEYAALHYDIQQEYLDWQGEKSEDLISFTISIELPSNGGGLFTWEVYGQETDFMDEEETDAFVRKHERIFHKYKVGNMAVHSGQLFHQMSPMLDVQEEDKRITLQGHGTKIKGKYCLYW